MSKDEEIWKKSLSEDTDSSRFETKPGGKNAKALPKKQLFKTIEEKKDESKYKVLEKKVDELEKEINILKRVINKLLGRKQNIQEVDENNSKQK